MEKKTTMRSKGEGTISKRCTPKCRRRDDERINHKGGWCGAYYDDRGIKTFVYGQTQQAAGAKLKEALRAKEEHRAIVPAALSTGKYLANCLEHTAKARVRPSTYRSYEQMIRVHILPALGTKPIAKLTATDVRTFLNAKREGGLSARSVQYLHAIPRSALGDGLSDRVLAHNPALIKRAVKVEREAVPALSP